MPGPTKKKAGGGWVHRVVCTVGDQVNTLGILFFISRFFCTLGNVGYVVSHLGVAG